MNDPYDNKTCLACIGVSAVACIVSLYVFALTFARI